MRKATAMIMMLILVCVMTACASDTDNGAGTSNQTSDKMDDDASSEPESSMVLDNSATDEAADIELPVNGIGKAIKTDVKAKESYKIGLIVKNNTNPYMALAADGAKKAADDIGFEINVQAPATADSAEEQVAIMESMIEGGIDAFVIIPIDSNGIVPAVNKAHENDIQVAAIGTAPNCDIFLRTGADYYPSGVAVGESMFDEASGKGGLVIIEGPAGAQNAIERLQGIEDAMAEYPEIELLASQPANWNRVEAMNVMENILQQDGIADKLTMVIGCNSEMAIGAYQAIAAAGLDEKVKIGSFDGFHDDVQMVQDGSFYCTYNMDPFSATYLACTYLVQNLNDGTMPEKSFIPFPTAKDGLLITADNVEEFLKNKAPW